MNNKLGSLIRLSPFAHIVMPGQAECKGYIGAVAQNAFDGKHAPVSRDEFLAKQ